MALFAYHQHPKIPSHKTALICPPLLTSNFIHFSSFCSRFAMSKIVNKLTFWFALHSTTLSCGFDAEASNPPAPKNTRPSSGLKFKPPASHSLLLSLLFYCTHYCVFSAYIIATLLYGLLRMRNAQHVSHGADTRTLPKKRG